MPASFASPAEAFRAAVALVGTQQAMATELGVAQPSIWRWMRSKRGVPGEHVIKVEEATKKHITRYDLRPDLYPEETTQLDPRSAGMEPVR